MSGVSQAEDEAARERVVGLQETLREREELKKDIKRRLLQADKDEGMVIEASQLKRSLEEEEEGVKMLGDDHAIQTRRVAELHKTNKKVEEEIKGLDSEVIDMEEEMVVAKKVLELEEERKRALEKQRQETERRLDEVKRDMETLRAQSEGTPNSRTGKQTLQEIRSEARRVEGMTFEARRVLESHRKAMVDRGMSQRREGGTVV